jgi:membrane associated rhomboid family serine protease
MLLLPVGQLSSTVRRYPWVTYVLLALNVGVFSGMLLMPSEEELHRELKKLVEEVADELMASPYLSVPPEVEGFLDQEFLASLAKRRAAWSEQGGVPDPARIIQAQTVLDEQGHRAVAIMDRLPERRFGFVPLRPSALTMLTSSFIHEGWLHLLANLLFLFVTAPFLEDLYGRPVFAVLYALCAAAACNAHALALPGSSVPLVGASGAIAGVMGAYLVRLATARIRFLLLPIPIVPAIRIPIVLPAFVVFPLWLAEQTVYAFATNADIGVAWWAHIGGFAFGAFAALLLKLTRFEETFVNPAIERRISLAKTPAFEEAIEARVAGDFARARLRLREALAEAPQNVDMWAEAYELALASRAKTEVPDLVSRLIETYERMGEPQLASTLVDERRWEALGPMPTQFLMNLASYLDRVGDKRAALGYYEQVITAMPADLIGLRALLRSAEIRHNSGDLAGARAAYQAAARHPGCTGALASMVEKGLSSLPAPQPRVSGAVKEEYCDRSESD